MSETIPVIGITGGIGSGKSYVAQAFKNYGCEVSDADSNVKKVLNQSEIQDILKSWWGDMVINEDKTINRRYIASIVFKEDDARKKLESLVHPIVRKMQMEQFKNLNNSVVAFIIDAPLLLETDLHKFCDKIIFVEASYELRLKRVELNRGWSENDLKTREDSQYPLDKKANSSDYVIINEGNQASVLMQIERILEDIKGTRI